MLSASAGQFDVNQLNEQRETGSVGISSAQDPPRVSRRLLRIRRGDLWNAHAGPALSTALWLLWGVLEYSDEKVSGELARVVLSF